MLGRKPAGIRLRELEQTLARRHQLTESVAAASALSLTEYKQARFRGYIHSYMLECLDHVLTQVARYYETEGREGIGRLIISVPRRYSKSTAVECFCAWLIENFPDIALMFITGKQDVADRASSNVRDMIQLPLRQDTRSKRVWRVANRGGYFTARTIGVGGTSWGHKVLICDDLVTTREQAMSVTQTEKIWNELRATVFSSADVFYAPRIVIGTRWSKLDPIGRLLANEPNEWVNFKLPALVHEPYEICGLDGEVLYQRQPGEPLDPRVHTIEQLRKIEETESSIDWASIWQQQPLDAIGTFFKREWFQVVPADSVPPMKVAVRGWDLAMTDAEYADFTAGVMVGVGADDNFYIIEAQRAHWDWGDLAREIARVIKDDPPEVEQVIEKAGAMSRAIIDLYTAPELSHHSIREQAVTGKKSFRAMPLRGRFQAGKMYLVQGGWNDAFIDEFTAFLPDGKGSAHDDQVDACSLAYSALGDAATLLGARWFND